MSNPEGAKPLVKPPKSKRSVRIVIRGHDEKHYSSITVYDTEPATVDQGIRELFGRRRRTA